MIRTTFAGTAAILAVMASVATVSKRDFSALGKRLTAGVVVLLLASVANIFPGMSTLAIVISVMASGILSAFILHDVQRIVNGGEANDISATSSIYVSVYIYNIFANLLALLGIGGSGE